MLLGLAFVRACRQGTNHALPTAASPEAIEAKLPFSIHTRAIDGPPVRRYSSRQRKRLFNCRIQQWRLVRLPICPSCDALLKLR